MAEWLGSLTATRPVSARPLPALGLTIRTRTLASVLGEGQISSAARSATKNTAAVGGSPTSSHLDAQAVDWIPKDGNTRCCRD